VIRLKPCPCRYWDGQDPDTSDGSPMVLYCGDTGEAQCVECSRPMEYQLVISVDQLNPNPKEETITDTGFKEGDRVRLVRSFERYPHCFIEEGATGTVTLVATHPTDDIILAVRWDDHVDGLQEWDNEGHWNRDDVLNGDVPSESLIHQGGNQ